MESLKTYKFFKNKKTLAIISKIASNEYETPDKRNI